MGDISQAVIGPRPRFKGSLWGEIEDILDCRGVRTEDVCLTARMFMSSLASCGWILRGAVQGQWCSQHQVLKIEFRAEARIPWPWPLTRRCPCPRDHFSPTQLGQINFYCRSTAVTEPLPTGPSDSVGSHARRGIACIVRSFIIYTGCSTIRGSSSPVKPTCNLGPSIAGPRKTAMAPSEKSWSRNLRFGTGRLLLLSWSLLVASASSRLVNITVDDTFGDPTTGLFPEYLPNNGTWNAGSSSEDCPTCYIGPSTLNLTQIHNGTWHDTTYLPLEASATITVRFNGSAVYVYNILPNTLPSTITLANISFSIDGEYVDRFIRAPESGSTILYNQLVYHNTTLHNGPHDLTMTAGDNSLVLFDYLIYTTESDDTTSTPNSASKSSSSSTPAGAIVGAVIGGVVLLGAAIGGLFLYRRHRRSIATQSAVHAYMEDSTNGGSELKCPVGEYHTYSPPPPTPMTPTSPVEPIMRSLGVPIAYIPSVLEPGDEGPGIEAQSARSPVVAGAPSPSTVDWSLRRRAELTQRLEALQRTRSVLSSQAPSSLLSRFETSTISETRTEVAIRELEAEMAQLRGVLSTLNARLAEGHGGHLDPLPEYEE